MNLVLDDAEEVHMKTKNRKPLGKRKLRIFTIFIFIFFYFLLLFASLSNFAFSDDAECFCLFFRCQIKCVYCVTLN